ncbi:MAG: hypothetical protein ACKO1M_00735 [Planctomycetota bacterium]
MILRACTRAFEQRCLRPLGRLLRKARPRGAGRGRIDQLERRVEELEGLVRELTGLAYLALDEREPAGGGPTAASTGAAREAA